MATTAALALAAGDNVVVLRWPEQRTEAERLARLSIPILLLVEPGASPPEAAGCLEDWIRLPADDGDVRARLHGLLDRAVHHPALPELDGYGQCSFLGRRVYLSATDERVAAVLVAAYGRGVSEAELLERVWPEGGSASNVRVRVSRLRKRLAPIGLEIVAIRNFGYRLCAAGTAA